MDVFWYKFSPCIYPSQTVSYWLPLSPAFEDYFCMESRHHEEYCKAGCFLPAISLWKNLFEFAFFLTCFTWLGGIARTFPLSEDNTEDAADDDDDDDMLESGDELLLILVVFRA